MCLETTSPLSSRQASSIINDQEAHDSTKPAVYNYENGCKQDDVDKATRDVNQTKQTFGHSRCMVMNEESCIHNGLTESPTSPTPLLFLERRAEQRLKQNNANLCSEHSHRQLRGKTLLNWVQFRLRHNKLSEIVFKWTWRYPSMLVIKTIVESSRIIPNFSATMVRTWIFRVHCYWISVIVDNVFLGSCVPQGKCRRLDISKKDLNDGEPTV